jgi:competence protein ComGF
MTEKELKNSLYYSKEPRQIQYTPYTLGQYKQMNPKEYVEIVPHIKPGK